MFLVLFQKVPKRGWKKSEIKNQNKLQYMLMLRDLHPWLKHSTAAKFMLLTGVTIY